MAGVYHFPKESENRWYDVRFACASSTERMIRESIVSDAGFVTRTSSEPFWLMVPAKTSSPGPRWTGTGSPVTAAWSTYDDPAATVPSTGIRSPGRTITISPTPIVSTAQTDSQPFRRTSASFGTSAMSDRIAPLALSTA